LPSTASIYVIIAKTEGVREINHAKNSSEIAKKHAGAEH